ncbi:MAG: pantoate--beta-alanine ligase [Bacteroidales bacterium]|nr:pantoate--beta-alanine ligase [Bacteroidales bacterium]
MQKITTVEELQHFIASAYEQNKSIGFVPTMGALHDGHLSLVARACKENDIVVVSVFVNPIQFNNPEDLAKYPRTIDADLAKLQKANADVAFVPSTEEMYPKPVTEVYHFGQLEEVMEGPRRPGHFSGVAVVLRRLFELVQPQRAYFGEKDFQQVAVVRDLLRQLHSDIQLVPCPIVREADGLAMSSRNIRLSEADRKVAPLIYATLKEAVLLKDYVGIADTKAFAIEKLKLCKVFDPEYFEIVNDTTLQPVARWDEATGIVGCITVWLGGVRLIDMIRFK